MERTILQYAPDYWDKSCSILRSDFLLGAHSEEYRQIAFEVRRASRNTNLNITSIKRNQNIHDYGQQILREQLLAVSNPGQTYYRVRRYVTIRSNYINPALEYNIDPRRCGMPSLIFKKHIDPSYGDIIIVVQVVTTEPDADSIEPRNSSDYFIDYIVEI